ncbi:MAG: hypothetical protein ACK4YX_09885, partial [Rhabdaerophilum calidifontis]
AFEFFTPAEAIEPTMVGAELLDLAEMAVPDPAPAPRRRKAKAEKTEAAAPAIAAPAAAEAPAPSPYDDLATEAKIRAFR